jgi:hypothetical protein
MTRFPGVDRPGALDANWPNQRLRMKASSEYQGLQNYGPPRITAATSASLDGVEFMQVFNNKIPPIAFDWQPEERTFPAPMGRSHPDPISPLPSLFGLHEGHAFSRDDGTPSSRASLYKCVCGISALVSLTRAHPPISSIWLNGYLLLRQRQQCIDLNEE